MKQFLWRQVAKTAVFPLTLLLILAWPLNAAFAPGPLVIFTDNITATTISPDPTAMEQQLGYQSPPLG